MANKAPNDERAPISPTGWVAHLHYYDGRPPAPYRLGAKDAYERSLFYWKRFKTMWQENHSGNCEMVISPTRGWESISDNPFGAISWAIAQDLVSIQHGAALIRAIAEEVVGRHPAEGTLGLALYYLRATVESLGGDDGLESVAETLSEHLRGIVGGVDDPMPF